MLHNTAVFVFLETAFYVHLIYILTVVGFSKHKIKKKLKQVLIDFYIWYARFSSGHRMSKLKTWQKICLLIFTYPDTDKNTWYQDRAGSCKYLDALRACVCVSLFAIGCQLSPEPQSSGIEILETDTFKLHCHQTMTGK